MRILYLSPSGHLGGAERSLMDVLASVRKAEPGWTLSLITGSAGPLIAKAATIGVRARAIPFPPELASLGDAGAGGPAGNQTHPAGLLLRCLVAAPTIALYLRRLSRAIRQEAPDVVHTNGFKMHILGIWSRPERAAVIWHVHDYASARPLMGQLLRRHAGGCAVAIANSESVADDLRSVCGARLAVRTVLNAVDLERFSPNGPVLDLDTLAGLPPATPGIVRVGLIGTFSPLEGTRGVSPGSVDVT